MKSQIFQWTFVVFGAKMYTDVFRLQKRCTKFQGNRNKDTERLRTKITQKNCSLARCSWGLYGIRRD